MALVKEFKEFALRGNVVDMAIGIIIGAAFGKIVSSLVADVVMPPLGVLLGNVDFSDLAVTLKEGSEGPPKVEPVVLAYGRFINSVIDFVILAFVIFLVIRQMNRLKRKEPAPSPTDRPCPYCVQAVSLKATRCPHCTSELEPASA